jgi:formamidopyrimidine-DNA glycosylase
VPELPEAETIARDLDRRVRGARIAGLHSRHDDVLARPAPDLDRALRGLEIARVGRRGKNVVVEMEAGQRLVVNLGMTGRLVLSDSPRAGELMHVAVRFDLEDGRALLYDDVRRFGLIQLYAPDEWAGRDAALGIEPLSDDFTGDALRALTRRSRTPIRNFLLDQSRVAGVGNIYALEALFRAGVRPSRRANRITRAEAGRLAEALRAVLGEAIINRGTTFSDYRDGSGEAGGFEPLLRVYGREGRPCVNCGVPVRRRVMTNRSIFYCPACQR